MIVNVRIAATPWGGMGVTYPSRVAVCGGAMSTLVLLLLLVQAPAAPDKIGQVVMKKTTSPERDWALYVPRSYNPRVPIKFVISSHGRDGRGKGEMGQWQDLASKHDFIVACPDYSMASGRPGTFEDDEKVTLEVYKYVTDRFSVDRKAVMITGFSGGGMPTYHDGTRHPELFPFWGGRSANWYTSVMPDEEQLKKCSGVALYIYYGDKDHELILDQAPKAHEAFKPYIKDIKFEKIEGMGHESRAPMCAQWFIDKVAEAKKREALMAPATKALKAAEDFLAKGKLTEAVAELKKADTHMRKYSLGDEAAVKIDELSDAELKKAGEAEKDAAIKILEAAKKLFAGTRAEKKIAEKLKELHAP